MPQSAGKSFVSGKMLAVGVLGLASVVVTAVALREFNVYPNEVSGTIAPAQRFVSDQIGTGDALDESPGSATKGGSVESTLENSMESSLESSMESALSSSMTSSMARDEDCGTRCSPHEPTVF